MNPKPFDSLNHFTVPTATLCSLRTGAFRPYSPILTDRPTRPHWSGAGREPLPDTKNAAGDCSCGNASHLCARATVRRLLKRSIDGIVGEVKRYLLEATPPGTERARAGRAFWP